jgi:hypothetical protein
MAEETIPAQAAAEKTSENGLTFPARSSVPEPDTAALAATCETIFLRIEKALAGIEKLHAQVWADYMELAATLTELSAIATRRSGSRNRRSGGYAKEMRRLLGFRAPRFSNPKHEGLRSALLGIHEHRDEFDLWRDELTDRQREAWRSPLTLWARFQASRKPARGRPVATRPAAASYLHEASSPLDADAFWDLPRNEVAPLVAETRHVGLDAMLRRLAPPDSDATDMIRLAVSLVAAMLGELVEQNPDLLVTTATIVLRNYGLTLLDDTDEQGEEG